MSKLTLNIVPFENRGGSTSYRVSGTVLGKQLRKNFPTLVEAEVFKRGILAKHTQVETVQIVSTRLRQDDMPRIEAWVEKLGGVDALGGAVEFFLKHKAPAVTFATPYAAVEAFEADRLKRGVKKKSVMKAVLGKMLRQLEVESITQLTADRLRPWIYDTSVTARTRSDRRMWLFGFFKFLKKIHAWEGASPIDEIERPMWRAGLPGILTLDRVQMLVDEAANDVYGETGEVGVMLGYFTVCLFTGIRPEEAQKLGRGRPKDPKDPKGERTDGWEFVHFENKLIELPPDMVKVGGVRNVPLQDNALAILAEVKRRKLPFCFFSKRVFNRVREAAGVLADWESDVQRHCYATYHYAVHKDVKFLESAMGNSSKVLFKHYIRRTVTESQGNAYAAITPAGWGLSLPPSYPPRSVQPKPEAG